ncbi:MAG: IS66 family transposase [Pseudomonadota bacterium]
MTSTDLPDDIAALKAMLLREAEARISAEAAIQDRDAEIANLKLTIAKLQRDRFGATSERSSKLIEQMELQLCELETAAAQSRASAEIDAPEDVDEPSRAPPARRPLPDHLPRERHVHDAPTACHACGSNRIRKLGEDVSETLEYVPARWKVIQHVREKFTCRDCESISQTPAPNHPIARGRAGPKLLAHVLYAKYRLHLPLNRQRDHYAKDGVHLDISTLADWVGACAATLQPLVERIEQHVLAAERVHADDTTVPVLAKSKCRTGRLWVYVRDDKPFAGDAAPAALFHYSGDRTAQHPEAHLAKYTGLMQADAYSGYNGLYVPGRAAGPITEVACWAHARRKFFDIAELQKSPVAIEAVRKIDALFAIERDINGKPPDERVAVRRDRSRPLVDELRSWLENERRKLSSKHRLAKAADYVLKRWSPFVHFLDDGRICLSNNAAERAVRGIAVGRKNWLFAGSDSGGRRAAAILSLIETCKLNDVDAEAWLAEVLARLADHPAKHIDDLLPWNWKPYA